MSSLRDHLDLSSFPTRRSSDLILRVLQYATLARGPAPIVAARAPGADRKSTRLNSSHQIISYAVFCLKKKSHAARTVQALHVDAPVEAYRPLVRLLEYDGTVRC